MSATYSQETCDMVKSWTDDTKIKYVAANKRLGSESDVRYQKYKTAKTVGQALALGSKRSDLYWDLDRGILVVPGGSSSSSSSTPKKAAKSAVVKAMKVLSPAKAASPKKESPSKKTRKEALKSSAPKGLSAGAKLKVQKIARRVKSLFATIKEKKKGGTRVDFTREDGSKRGHTSYTSATYMEITRWTANTRISYKPHAKSPGSKSHVRYEAYSQAQTVGESLEYGSWPADWCWDWEHGFITVWGEKREEPLDMDTVQDKSTLTEVDKVVGKWFKREAARLLGVDLKNLDKSWHERVIDKLRRTIADQKAEKIMEEADAEGRHVRDDEIVQVLNQWSFRPNESRQNVIPEGQKSVRSDTLGLIPSRDGRIMATQQTLDYPNFTKLMNRWYREHAPEDLSFDFRWTSININKDYAARIHRDGANIGLSMIKAFGDFQGGLLRYWADDKGGRKPDVEDVFRMAPNGYVTLDLKKGLALFDGKRAHSVEDFSGHRYTIVFFTCRGFDKATATLKKDMEDRGMKWPTKDTVAESMKALAPPRGYEQGIQPKLGEGQFGYWEIKAEKAKKRRSQ